MKIVVIGGTGLIGAKLVEQARAAGHEAVAGVPGTGVNTITGEGLAEVLDRRAGRRRRRRTRRRSRTRRCWSFFQTSARNLLAAEAAAGVRHHVALSVVGADRMPDSGYMRAKVAQEALIKAAPVPFTIVRATQFFEFLGSIAEAATEGDTVRLPPRCIQPIAAEDVASALADVAPGAPTNATIDVAGHDRIRLDELVRRFLAASGDPRVVVTDAHAGYFGAALADDALTPGGTSRLGATRFAAWLERSATRSEPRA